MNSKKKNRIGYALILLIIIGGLIMVFMQMQKAQQNKKVIYSDIIEYFDDYKVKEYTLDLNSHQIVMKVEGQEKPINYVIPDLSLFFKDTNINESTYRAEYNKRHPDEPMKQNFLPVKNTLNIISVLILPLFSILIIVGLFYFMMKQAGGGGKISNFGKANVKPENSSKKTTFEDVAGSEEEKEELTEVVDFLKHPKKYQDMGAKIPKGVLLLGPPGTGKTLLARAVAGEANVPFYLISGSDFVEMFVGVGAARVRDLFETAKKNAPAIIFIDEIDAVGRQRGTGVGGGHDEREQTLNQLLVEMDGFSANESVIVMAATNRKDVLDPALLRPGRFDRQIYVGAPDIKEREAILKVHAKNKPLGPDVNLKTIAQTTAGFTGADLANLLNEASLLAARASRKAITQRDIEEATIKVIAGPEKKSRVVTPSEKKLTSYHEAGHAVCTFYCPSQDKVHQITIIPRGMAGGMTISLPEHDKSYTTKTEMKENIVVLLGGRMAEKIILGDISTGASNDIERATAVAKAMVTKYGFSDKLGPITYGGDQNEVFLGRDFSNAPSYSDNVAAEIDAEIREIIDEAYERAKDILTEHIDQLHIIAQHLMKHEIMGGDLFDKFMNGEITPEEYEEEQRIQEEKQQALEEQAKAEEAAKGKVIDVTIDESSEVKEEAPSDEPAENDDNQ